MGDICIFQTRFYDSLVLPLQEGTKELPRAVLLAGFEGKERIVFNSWISLHRKSEFLKSY